MVKNEGKLLFEFLKCRSIQATMHLYSRHFCVFSSVFFIHHEIYYFNHTVAYEGMLSLYRSEHYKSLKLL